MKTSFTEAEVRALARFVEDIDELCDLDDDLDIEIGHDVNRMRDILGLDENE